MAEFCPACWNELNRIHTPLDKYELSDDLYLCEGCGEYTLVVVGEMDESSYQWKLFIKSIKEHFSKKKKL